MILTTVMAHPRTAIRTAVIALLIGANTTAQARVDDSRVDDVEADETPFLSVYTLKEPNDTTQNRAPREVARDLKLEVVGWVSGKTGKEVARAMDDLAAQVEAAMEADPFLAVDVEDAYILDNSILEDTTMQVLQEDPPTDVLIGVVVMTYSVAYRSVPGVPVLDQDFLKAGVTTKVQGGVSDTTPAVDNFSVRPAP